MATLYISPISPPYLPYISPYLLLGERVPLMATSDAAVIIQAMVTGRSARHALAERRRRDKAAAVLSRGGTQWLARRTLKAAQEAIARREREAAALRMQEIWGDMGGYDPKPNPIPSPNHTPSPDPSRP